MTLVRWKPVRDQRALRRDISQWANGFLWGSERNGKGWRIRSWLPAMDLYESDQAVMLKVELPGFSKDDVQVEIKDHVLTLKGERTRDSTVQEEQYHRLERAYGALQRSFLLPTEIAAEAAAATLKDGVLKLTLPTAQEAKPKGIKVTAYVSAPPLTTG